jgi:hypothetical protein
MRDVLTTMNSDSRATLSAHGFQECEEGETCGLASTVMASTSHLITMTGLLHFAVRKRTFHQIVGTEWAPDRKRGFKSCASAPSFVPSLTVPPCQHMPYGASEESPDYISCHIVSNCVTHSAACANCANNDERAFPWAFHSTTHLSSTNASFLHFRYQMR